MEEKIHEIIKRFAARLRFDPEALREANRKQAMVPEGATALDPVGTAPGLVVPADGMVVIVLPGPPRELKGMWPRAIEQPAVREVLDRAEPFESFEVRMFGIPESELARSLREIEEDTDLSPLEITTCLRGGELVTDVRHRPGAEAEREALLSGLREKLGQFTYSYEGEAIESVIARLLGRPDARRRRVVHRGAAGGALHRARPVRRSGSPAASSATRTSRRPSCSASIRS